jgi:serine/threonine protein kinase
MRYDAALRVAAFLAREQGDELTARRPGEVVGGRFEVLGELGRGGMATVYRALDRTTGEHVALKLAHADEALRERFDREIALISEQLHPRIVRYVAHGTTDDDALFLASELIEGPSLATTIATSKLTPIDVARLLLHLAEALGAAHAAGVVHRDLKPENVLLRATAIDGAMVLDLGLASQRGACAQLTTAGTLLGTPGYLAPEQLRDPRLAGPPADVYALAVIGFECLTQRLPITGDTLTTILRATELDAPPDVRSIDPRVPDALATWLARAMSKDPSLRPASGDEAAIELRTILASLTATPVASDSKLTWRATSAVIASSTIFEATSIEGAPLWVAELSPSVDRRRLEAEIAALARLPSLARVIAPIGLISSDSKTFTVAPRPASRSLASLLEVPSWSCADALACAILRDVDHAIGAMHALDIPRAQRVHGALDPSWLFLDERGTTHVLGFGFERAALASKPYRPDEIAEVGAALITPRADVFAIGVLALELSRRASLPSDVLTLAARYRARSPQSRPTKAGAIAALLSNA